MPTPSPRLTPLDSSELTWRRSSRSSSAGGNCVETAFACDVVAVRDSKDREGPTLAFPQTAWESFVVGIKRRQFDGD